MKTISITIILILIIISIADARFICRGNNPISEGSEEYKAKMFCEVLYENINAIYYSGGRLCEEKTLVVKDESFYGNSSTYLLIIFCGKVKKIRRIE